MSRFLASSQGNSTPRGAEVKPRPRTSKVSSATRKSTLFFFFFSKVSTRYCPIVVFTPGLDFRPPPHIVLNLRQLAALLAFTECMERFDGRLGAG